MRSCLKTPDYDEAIIGVTHGGRVVYDYDNMVIHLMNEDDMTAEDAADFISYNTIRSLDYMSTANKPTIMYRVVE